MSYFSSAYEARDMSIDEMTEGLSVKGVQLLMEDINSKLLVGVQEKLTDTEAISTAIKAGWQGKSRDVFLEKLDQNINYVLKDLETEYRILVKRMQELVQNYYEQDAKMLDV